MAEWRAEPDVAAEQAGRLVNRGNCLRMYVGPHRRSELGLRIAAGALLSRISGDHLREDGLQSTVCSAGDAAEVEDVSNRSTRSWDMSMELQLIDTLLRQYLSKGRLGTQYFEKGRVTVDDLAATALSF